MTHCENCGTKFSTGICPNCEEELLITVEQAEYIDHPLSDEFMQKVSAQAQQVRQRAAAPREESSK